MIFTCFRMLRNLNEQAYTKNVHLKVGLLITYISLILQILLQFPAHVVPDLVLIHKADIHSSSLFDESIHFTWEIQGTSLNFNLITSINPSTEQETRNCPSGENLAHSAWLFVPNYASKYQYPTPSAFSEKIQQLYKANWRIYLFIYFSFEW